MKKTALIFLFSGLLLTGLFPSWFSIGLVSAVTPVYGADGDDMSDSEWGQTRPSGRASSAAASGARQGASSVRQSASSASSARADRTSPTQEQLELWRDTMLYGTAVQKEDSLKVMQNYRTKEVDTLLVESLRNEEEGPTQRRIIQLLHERRVEGALTPLEDALVKAQDPTTISSLISALAKFKEKSTLPLIVRYLTNTEVLVQQEAIRAIGAIGDPEPAAQLFEMLENIPTTDDMCYDLVNALGELKYAPAYDTLRTIAMNSANAQYLRAFAITALGKIGDKRILPDFLKLLNGETNPIIKLRVVAAFGDIPSDETISAIQKAMADRDDQVRTAAVTAAGKSRNKDLLNALLFRFRTDNDSRVMLAAAAALQEYGHADLPKLILTRFEGTRDINILSRFVVILKKCPPQQDAAPMLRKKQDENKHSKVKDEIQELLDQWGLAGSQASSAAARSSAAAQSGSQSSGAPRTLITQ